MNKEVQNQSGNLEGYSASVPPGLPQPPPPYTVSTIDPVVAQPRAADQNAVLPGSWGPVPPTVPTSASIPIPLVPVPPTNSPQGLQYLSLVDQLLVHQQVELLEVITGFETENKYQIKNSLGQQVYFAAEDSDFCTRNCCGPLRPFDMKIFDNYKNEVIHFYRPLACQACCYPCCLQTIEVSAPPGNPIGSVEQEWSIFYPTFAVKNANGDTVLRIEGPFFTCSCGNDVNFRITSGDGSEEIGKITKQWSGWVREAFTDADFFGITFPMDLDVKMKTVLLGGLFLIDMMFYETKQNNNRRR
ncbi:hypothetical protein Zmor_001191 [Zophobas morio]|uniref:Phospholipid scramblase n=1 Tax=Zophobas morio TaxID=2755281 RepID=A0AA38MP36_9CUCU|nr:hypothetical protein Zmor_001191 [Zophobas morio]